MRCVSCGTTTGFPKADNWKEFQKCYPCATDEHPEFYAGKHKHGTGGKYLSPPIYQEFMIAKD